MPTVETSAKIKFVRRTKALAVLLSPILVFGAILFLGSSLQSRLGTPRASQVAKPSETMSVTVQNSPTPMEGEVATGTVTQPNVTTYVITGSY